jgi:predicted RNA binding protein YcfA (HicA-like mRNA interferase family)
VVNWFGCGKDSRPLFSSRELIAELESAGFIDRSGKGSHRNFVHPKVARPVTLSGNPGDDAKHYQVRAVRLAIEESRK